MSNKKRNKNKVLFATDNPKPTEANYIKKIDQMQQQGKMDNFIKPGSVFHTVVYHDNWCGVYVGKNCNCNPDVVVMSDKEYKKKHAQ